MSDRLVSDPQQLRQLYALLDHALDLPAADRDAWLNALDREHQPLLPRLRALLAQSGVETDEFMKRPAPVHLPALEALSQPADGAGDHVGPYRLISEIGSGGMATVWLAEREDGTLHRQVALKLPRSGWNPGLLQRMARERDMLAALEHPHIARLYDAGVTAEGRPWLAMEFVLGQPIDVWCREHAADVPAILRLALQVCDALAHAHARLIVHRDLKPANILVTAEGQVRLVDFGVGKLLQDEAEGQAQLTQLHGNALTPDYASPEQVARKPLTVATDVYSLGVVLYELLTGERPYKLGRQTSAALEEAILGADVARPSSRSTDPARARALRGDLDAVLTKALAKKAEQRYASMESFASDLAAHLQGRPVAAQAPSRRYRVGKFVRRHRLPLLAATATAASLLLGTGVAWWQAGQARAQTAIALAALEMAHTGTVFSQAVMMEGLNADESITLRQLIDRSTAMAERSFNGRPIERVTAAMFAAEWLARTGERARGVQLQERVLATLGPDTPRPVLTQLRCEHGYFLVRLGQVAEGKRKLDEALAAPGDDGVVEAYCLHRRAATAGEEKRADDELRFMQRAMLAMDHAPHAPAEMRAQILADLGSALWDNGRQLEGRGYFQRAFALLQELGRIDSPASNSARHNFGIGLLRAGMPRDALTQFEGVMASAERHAPGARIALEMLSARAEALLQLAPDQAALEAFERLTEAARAQRNDAFLARGVTGQAQVLLALDRMPLADARHAEAQRLFESGQRAGQRPWPSAALVALAEGHHARGQIQQADQLCQTIVKTFAQGATILPGLVQARVLRSRIALDERRLDDAAALIQDAMDAARQLQGDFPRSIHTALALLSETQLRVAQGLPAQARTAAESALAHAQATGGDNHPLALQARKLLATLRSD